MYLEMFTLFAAPALLGCLLGLVLGLREDRRPKMTRREPPPLGKFTGPVPERDHLGRKEPSLR